MFGWLPAFDSITTSYKLSVNDAKERWSESHPCADPFCYTFVFSERKVAAVVFVVELLQNLWGRDPAEDQGLLRTILWRSVVSWRTRRGPIVQREEMPR